jgi:hypothetical protein
MSACDSQEEEEDDENGMSLMPYWILDHTDMVLIKFYLHLPLLKYLFITIVIGSECQVVLFQQLT